ncbi:BamA/TamA family outer membrane protein [Flammeovirga sp. SubArs3]|uniref:BamA/TamA family outer membrane protein n=1 Tax=Flammeovirga sp. SubArs3 TaxID=2995316 RepID=UPI00248BACCD|nr:BamA/TamA family outer membrane protein [Flammeovirga sp. SubArs3]
MKKLTCLFCLVFFVIVKTSAQSKKRDFKYSILGGPAYSPDYGLLVGGTMLCTFRTSKTIQQRSVVPLSFTILEEGHDVIIKPQLYFAKGKIRVFSNWQYLNKFNHFYGIGYEENISIKRGDHTTRFFQNSVIIRNDILFRINKTPFFLGPSIDYTNRILTHVSKGVREDLSYIEQGGTDKGAVFNNVGIGVRLSYDTRDIPSNAWSGIYFDFSMRVYDKALSSSSDWDYIKLEYRQYKKLPRLGERKVLAWTAYMRTASGNIPFTELSTIGSPFDLRGYYKGQFRDKTSAYVMVEFRSMVNSSSKFLSKFGYAVWSGVGTIGPDIFTPKGVLPNIGLGLRFEVQPRMNFRIDIGHDPIQNQQLIYFNMTEAF